MKSIRRRLEARKARKRQEAYDRLHGKGAVSVPPRPRSRSAWFDEDDVGDLVVDILTALPRGVLWLLSKILD